MVLLLLSSKSPLSSLAPLLIPRLSCVAVTWWSRTCWPSWAWEDLPSLPLPSSKGMTDLQTTHTTLNQAVIDYHTNRDTKGFSDRHGTALGQRVQNWCNVPDDLALPEVHRLAAAAHKHQLHGILNNQFQTRALASRVPLTLASAPLATTKLVDEVFRNYAPGGTGLVFAQGLSPFSVVCEGHAERELVVKKIRQATMAEQGSTLSLSDAESLTSTDVRFAAEPQVAAEKLCRWAALLEVFHGAAHAVAINAVELCLGCGTSAPPSLPATCREPCRGHGPRQPCAL